MHTNTTRGPSDRPRDVLVPAMTRLTLTDGSSWPRPSLESDETLGIGHRLRYAEPATLSRAELLEAAAIVDAYGALVVETTRAKRDLICREVRAAIVSGE